MRHTDVALFVSPYHLDMQLLAQVQVLLHGLDLHPGK